jgi:hypothetical protein
MMAEMPFTARVFLVLGAGLLAIGGVLFALGSFGWLAAAALGLFFIAQGLIARAIAPPLPRLGIGLLLTAVFVYLGAGVATPLLWVALATAVLAVGVLGGAALTRRTR